MQYQSKTTDTTFFVTISGPITEDRSGAVKECFAQILKAKQPFVEFDFRQVPVVSSRYLGEFILLARSLAKQERQLVLTGVQEELFRMFQSINLGKVLNYER